MTASSKPKLPLLLGAVLLAGAAAAGAACHAESGPTLTPLVELYTSEGCDSCPPAERWLSTLRPVDGIVALAFHVDYWDHLGWRDRFARPAFSTRQQQRSRSSGAGFLYTPQVIVSGRDFPGWRRLASPGALPREPVVAGADLSLEAQAAADGRLHYRLAARLRAARPGERAQAWLALHESGLISEVGSGENAGKRLRHDFVVRDWRGPFPLDADGRLDMPGALPGEGIVLRRAGLSAIVESADGKRVLQALNLPLAEPSCGTVGTVESPLSAFPPSRR